MKHPFYSVFVGVLFLPMVFGTGKPAQPTPTATPSPSATATATATATETPSPTPTSAVIVGTPHPGTPPATPIRTSVPEPPDPITPTIDAPVALELLYIEDGSAMIAETDAQRVIRVLAAACVRPEMGCTPAAHDTGYAIRYLYDKWDDHQPALVTFAGQNGHANDICTYILADGEDGPLDHDPCN